MLLRLSNCAYTRKCVQSLCAVNCVFISFELAELFIIGFIPAPIVIGHFIDVTCKQWPVTCSSSGACLIYDVVNLRYVIHITVLVLLTLKTFLYVLLLSLRKVGENMQET